MIKKRWRRVLLGVLIVIAQVRLEPSRWWRSPPIIGALQMTPEQSRAAQRVYEESQEARTRTAQEVMELTAHIIQLLRAGQYEGELLQLTERLARAQTSQCEMRRQLFVHTADALTPAQRRRLRDLVGEERLAE